MPADNSSLIDEARRLGPLIQQTRDESEQSRRLAPPVLAALHHGGLFRMLIPADVGGLQTDLATVMEVVEAVSAADGAVGWNLMIGCVYGVWASRLGLEAARAIFGAPDAVVAGALRPSGRLRAVEHGFIADGRWSFASGIDHSQWWLGACALRDGDGSRPAAEATPDVRLVFFPARDGERIDTWDAGGMRGTGSHDYAISNLFIAADRTIALDAPSRLAVSLYHMPIMALLDSPMATVPLGIARSAIDAFMALAAGKRSHGFAAAPASRPTIQADVGRAEAVLRAARAWLYESVEEARADIEAGRELTPRQLALLRLARTNAVTASVQAVDLMYAAAAGSAVYNSNPLERCFRDVHVAAAHVALHPANYETCGRVMLGLPAGRSLV